jgi:hypothetical protein
MMALLKPIMNLGVETFPRSFSTKVWILSKIIFIDQISSAKLLN